MPSKIRYMLTMILAGLVGTAAMAASRSVAVDDGTREARRLTVDTEFRSLGCYNAYLDELEHGSGVMESYWGPGPLYSDNLTTQDCAEHCILDAFFATINGRACFCGYRSDYGDTLYAWDGESDQCNLPCSGDAGDICGGTQAISVYQYTRKYDYWGCWRDWVPPILSGKRIELESSMTTQVCEEKCDVEDEDGEKYWYFGTTSGKMCFCGKGTDNYNHIGKSSFCNSPCSGDSEDTCGGHFLVDVYRYKAGFGDDD